ncbi:hypothetical protein ACFOJ6_23850 [Gordonia humi]|uniref:hypothetical protein n=1 Tax=Gordonia humi TaxID=686429 RepID=UPI0036235C17
MFTDGVDVDDAQRAELAVMGVTIVDGRVLRLQMDGIQVRSVVLTDRTHDVDAVVVGPRMVARGDLYERLGGELADHPMGRFVPSGPGGATPIEGVWAVGNAVDLAAMVASSAGSGVAVGAAVNADLLADDVRDRLAEPDRAPRNTVPSRPVEYPHGNH